MKSAERKWLALLAVVAASALTGVNAYLASEAKAEAEESRARLVADAGKKRMSSAERSALQTEIETLQGQATATKGADAPDPVALGSDAKREFSRSGLEVKSYSVAQGKRASVVEFELEGEAAGLSSLLSSESAAKTAFFISRFTVATSDRPGRLRIGIGVSPLRAYGPSASVSESAAAALLASLSPRIAAAKAAPSPPAPSASPVVERPTWIAFIGKTIQADGTPVYYLKDNKQGSMLELGLNKAGDAVISETDASVTIRYQGAQYEIRKQ